MYIFDAGRNLQAGSTLSDYYIWLFYRTNCVDIIPDATHAELSLQVRGTQEYRRKKRKRMSRVKLTNAVKRRKRRTNLMAKELKQVAPMSVSSADEPHASPKCRY